MNGSIVGNCIGILFFLLFQVAGILLADLLLPKERAGVKAVLGSALGSFGLQWCPVPFAFFLGFSRPAQVCGALFLLPVFLLTGIKMAGSSSVPGVKNRVAGGIPGALRQCLRKEPVLLVVCCLTFVLWLVLLDTHTLKAAENGGLHCGQSTYGDMSMHLGFITGLAVQEDFPPEYTIFPGTRLSYPFLSDSISAGLYQLGMSLRLAYMLPMVTAFVQIMGAVLLLARQLLGDPWKKLLAFALFFYNGGLGVFYFLGLPGEKTYTLKELFTGYYQTPTNLIDCNIRWVNVIADMLLPQRATLFGYAIAFPCLYLLYRGAFCEKEDRGRFFALAGVLAAGLPMIHTHSFLAVGLIAASWLLLELCRRNGITKFFRGGILLLIFLTGMEALYFLVKREVLSEELLLQIALIGAGLTVLLGLVLLVRSIRCGERRRLQQSWGIFLLIVLLPAAIQLCYWTFGQVAEGGFVRGHFNWGNLSDTYVWFYLKNIGIPLVFIVLGCFQKKKWYEEMLLPAGVIFFLAELVVFTPNPYDNNKLLYVAYLLLVMVAADVAVDMIGPLRNSWIRAAAGTVLSVLFLSAAILTLGREVISDYQVYSPEQVKLAQFLENFVEPEAVILTDTRHVNEVAALAGRKIICGSDFYLYYHGIRTGERKAQVQSMYENPEDSGWLYQRYGVKYVLVSPWERSSYEVDEEWFAEHCKPIYDTQSVILYALP